MSTRHLPAPLPVCAVHNLEMVLCPPEYLPADASSYGIWYGCPHPGCERASLIVNERLRRHRAYLPLVLYSLKAQS